MKALKLAVVLTLLFGTANTFAAGMAGSGPNPYSDCGIGAALFKNNIAATISNVIWDIGTTAVISATASPETCSGKEASTARLIFEAYPNFEDETAKGSGDHLVAMLDILECSPDVRGEIISNIRQDFAELLTQDGYTVQSRLAKAESYYNIVMDQATACGS